MSQQEMGFESVSRDGPSRPYTGYEGSQYNTFTASFGQKLPVQPLRKTASIGQRLFLAIVSLLMLMVITFGVISAAFSGHDLGRFFLLFLLFLVSLFYVAVIIINIVFNRNN